MPNVDQATRILNFVSSDEYSRLSEVEKDQIINDFLSISDRNRPTSFRGLERRSVSCYFNNLNLKLREFISDIIDNDDISLIEDSNDNRVGSDLIVISNRDREEITRVELKFGSETNRNIGNNTMDQVFSFYNTNNNFSLLFSDIYIQQRNYVSANDLTPNDFVQIEANLNTILQTKVEILNDLFNNNNLRINGNMMAQLLLTTGAIDNVIDNNIIKINVSYTSNVEEGINRLDLPNVDGEWQIEEISMSPQSTRIQILVTNDFISTKFLLNWKNNHTYRGRRYAAKLGLGSTSWNVWVYM